jgi:hypothetical protein
VSARPQGLRVCCPKKPDWGVVMECCLHELVWNLPIDAVGPQIRRTLLGSPGNDGRCPGDRRGSGPARAVCKLTKATRRATVRNTEVGRSPRHPERMVA